MKYRRIERQLHTVRMTYGTGMAGQQHNNYQSKALRYGYDDVMLQVRLRVALARERERHQCNYIAYVWIRLSSFGHLKVGF
jgi:hypothetical protein